VKKKKEEGEPRTTKEEGEENIPRHEQEGRKGTAKICMTLRLRKAALRASKITSTAELRSGKVKKGKLRAKLEWGDYLEVYMSPPLI